MPERGATYQPIACEDYDFVEIACLDRYEVAVETASGTLLARAVTTEVNQSGEFLVLTDKTGQQQMVRLDQIETLRVITQPSRFRERTFARS
ncbi:MAG: Rho-binding antiterminator [Pseudomonadota bacterium]